jgi:hypothetical protein
MSLAITPETTLGAVLDAHPGLEASFREWVPSLAKLKNPALWSTVAKATSLEQAAKMAGLAARDLVTRVCAATGQTVAANPLPVLNNSPVTAASHAAPAWIEEDRVRYSIDADQMLATGQHPVGRIRAWGGALEPGQLIKLTASFRPAPLIDMMRNNGFDAHSIETAPGKFATYFRRA